MALFKSKTRGRSSSSYASTITTLVFVALCVLGIWMLSSGSVVSPTNQATETIATQSAIDNSELTNNDLTSAVEEQVETATKTAVEDSSLETTSKVATEDTTETAAKSQDQKDTQTFGDNPGHLPDDAIKSDDKNPNNDQSSSSSVGESQISEESSLTQKQAGSEAAATETATIDSDKKLEEIPEQSSDMKTEENREPDQSIVNNASENQQQTQEDNNNNNNNVQSFEAQEQPKQDESSSELSKSSDFSEEEPKLKKTQKGHEESEETHKGKGKKKHKGHNHDNKDAQKSMLPKEETKKPWSSQADQAQKEKEGQVHTWHLCNVTAGADYIPCLDNELAISKLTSRRHFEHRERHCPQEPSTCLVPLPSGYKRSIEWPDSRDKIWYHNVPHTLLAKVKGHQNWVKVSGEFLTFPGGGTQFIHGALHYIDFLQEAEAKIAWGKHTRVILDVGCGVGSFGGFLFERDVVAMSFAPKDEHEAQVQFALERGIPAISAVMGSQRLQFPSKVFDLVHCARCRVPWHADGGLLLLELNRVLRPGGYFVWSATPVYQKLEEDVQIWKEMSSLTKAMCWELVTIKKDALNQIGAAIYRKPTSNKCYEERENESPPMCKEDDDPDAAWYVPLQACMHRVPVDKTQRATKWPEPWPRRVRKPPYWLNNTQVGIYGKPLPEDFVEDTEKWKNVVDELSNMGITWSNVRNVMDMRAVYGGFAAGLRELPVWVFNVVNVNAPDTLPIIYDRGLFGIYHDWCESFSTYPRTYDLLHADHLFSKLKARCTLVPVLAEVDRIVRPEGKLIVRDESNTIGEVENLLNSLHWEITFSKKEDGILCAKKGNWRPTTLPSSS